MSLITRFAPSPTGPLHLGHAYSAMLAHDMARADGGTFLLRIEDLDLTRSRPEWEQLIETDLAWLGIDWPRPVMRQSERSAAYRAALAQLWRAELLYPCTCRRRDILEAASAPQEGAPTHGPDGLIYPGTCRRSADRSGPLPAAGVALRLDMARALDHVGRAPGFFETGAGPNGETGEIRPPDLVADIGDVVLARREIGTAYHLAVVVDDAAQNVSHVVRGRDLFAATPIHVLLQSLLGLSTPVYHHHRLIRDAAGKRLAKRDDARAISRYRDEGATPADIRRLVDLPPAA